MTTRAELDTYARVTIIRVNRAIEDRDGIATRGQMERLRECYTQLHRDTKSVCARRRRDI
jgi:hypothetical protein